MSAMRPDAKDQMSDTKPQSGSQIELEQVRSYIRIARESGIERLPPERELADEIGLSRSRLRGVLKKLADEGSIWREVGNGTYFGQKPLLGGGGGRSSDLAGLTNPREVMEARLLLEPELAKLAAIRARGENVAELELCLRKMADSADRSDWSFWDQRFHHAIGRAADSTLLLALLETVQKNMKRGIWGELSDKLHQTESWKGSMADHQAIIAPIRNRNPVQAYEAMRAHLSRVQRIYFES